MYTLSCIKSMWCIQKGCFDLKIAMIGQKQVPSRMGGIEVAVGALAVRMSEKGHCVTLYNSQKRIYNKKNDRDIWRKNYNGIRICEVPVINVKGLSAVMGSVFATVLAVFGKYDCIHYHAEGPAVMLFVPYLLRIRTIVTIHGLDWKRSKWGRLASWYLKMGEKMAAACANEIIVLNRSTQNYFLQKYHRDTTLIPNGVERPISREAKAIKDKWGLVKDNYILYLGRIVPEKGLENLIVAFSAVKTEKRLVIAGAPSDTQDFYEKLMGMAKADRRIIFTGFVQGEILDELYSNSYFYCLPSEVEGMPISLLEAMSYGNCCLCSDIEECADIVGEFGYLFKCGDTHGLADIIQRLCDTPEMVEKCRKNVSDYVCNSYNWDEITERTLDVYKANKL